MNGGAEGKQERMMVKRSPCLNMWGGNQGKSEIVKKERVSVVNFLQIES